MPKTWNADLTITAVDDQARTWTATMDPDIWAITQSAPYLADQITVTVHVPTEDTEGQPVDPAYMQVGQTVKVSRLIAP